MINSKFPQGVQTLTMRTIYSEHNLNAYWKEICIYKRDDMTNLTGGLLLPAKEDSFLAGRYSVDVPTGVKSQSFLSKS
jgi:hypothetical protein